MKNKNTGRNRNKRFPPVGPITSREELVHAPHKSTMMRSMKSRLRVLEQHAQEAAQLRAAIKALGGDPHE